MASPQKLVKFGSVGLLKAVSASGVLFFNILILKYLDADIASRAVVAITLIFAATSFLKFGMDGLILRTVGANRHRGGIGRPVFRWISIFAVLTFLVLLISSAFFGDWPVSKFWMPFIVMVSCLFIFNCILSSALRGLGMQYVALFIEPGFAMFAASLLYLLSDKSVEAFLTILCFYSGILSALCFLYLMTCRDKGEIISANEFPFKEALGFWGFDLGNYALMWASNLIIFWLIAAEAVAEYSLHFRVAMMINFGLVVYNILRSPRTASLREHDEIKSLIQDIRGDTNRLFLISVAVFAIVTSVVLGSETGANIVSNVNLEVDLPLFILLSSGFLINVFYGPVGMVLNMRGHSLEVTHIFLISAVTYILLASVGSKIASVYGVATAFVLSQILQNFLMNQKLEVHFGVGIR